MTKTNEQLEADIAELREQIYIIKSAHLSMVEAIAVPLHLPGMLDKYKLAETIETLAAFAKRSPGADDPRTRGMLDFLQGAAQRLRRFDIQNLTEKSRLTPGPSNSLLA